MSAKKAGTQKDDAPKFEDIFKEFSGAAMDCIASGGAAAKILKKHWLLAQTELLKGLQEVVQMELNNIDGGPPAKRTKINIT